MRFKSTLLWVWDLGLLYSGYEILVYATPGFKGLGEERLWLYLWFSFSRGFKHNQSQGFVRDAEQNVKMFAFFYLILVKYVINFAYFEL